MSRGFAVPRHFLYFLLLAVVAASALGVFFHFKTLQNEQDVREKRLDSEAIALISASFLRDKLNVYAHLTRTAADNISTAQRFDDSFIVAMLSASSSKVAFDSLSIVFDGGRSLSTQEGMQPLYLIPWDSEDTLIPITWDGRDYIVFAAPIKTKDVIKAKVYGLVQVDTLKEMLDKHVAHAEVCCLGFLKNNGDFVFNPKHQTISSTGRNFLNFITAGNIATSISTDDIVDSFRDNRPVTVSYEYARIPQTYSFMPLGVDNWYVSVHFLGKPADRVVYSIDADTWMLLLKVSIILLAITFFVLSEERLNLRRVYNVNKMKEALMANIPGGVQRMFSDENLTYDFVSNGLTNLAGYYTPKDLTDAFQGSFFNGIYPKDREHTKKTILEQLAEKGEFEAVYRMTQRFGDIIFVLSKGEKIKDSGGREFIFCVTVDVTTTHRAAEDLRVSRERYKIMAKQSDLYIYDYDFVTDTLTCTERTSEKFAVPRKVENVSQNMEMFSVFSPVKNHKDIFVKMVNELRAGNRSASAYFEYLSADKKDTMYLHTSLFPLRKEDNTLTRIIGVTKDMTFRKKAEVRYLRAEKYTMALSEIYDRTYEFDLTNDRMIKGMEFLKDYVDGDVISVTDVFNNFTVRYTHPDDLAKVKDLFDARRVERYLKSGRSEFDIQYRNRSVDRQDSYCWIAAHVLLFTDPADMSLREVWHVKDMTNDMERIEELSRQAERDEFTGLFNKKRTEELITEKLLDDMRFKPRQVNALIMIDLDNFKQVNDTAGHLFGDKVLLAIAEKISSAFRFTDVVGRVGGDEFVVFMKNIPSIDIIETKAELMCLAIRDIEVEGRCVKEFNVTASCGVSVSPYDGDTFAALYRKSDMALYQAKELGKNRICFYDKSMEYDIKSGQANRIIPSDILCEPEISTLMPDVMSVMRQKGTIKERTTQAFKLIADKFSFAQCFALVHSEETKVHFETFTWDFEDDNKQGATVDNARAYAFYDRLREVCRSTGSYVYVPSRMKENTSFLFEDKNTAFCCAVIKNGKFRGYIVFYFRQDAVKVLYDRDIDDLTAASQIMALYL